MTDESNYEDAVCLAHYHPSREAEAICSLRHQLSVARKGLPQSLLEAALAVADTAEPSYWTDRLVELARAYRVGVVAQQRPERTVDLSLPGCDPLTETRPLDR